MCERRTLAISVLALLVAMSPVVSGQGAPPAAPAQGAAPQAPPAGGRAGAPPPGRAGGGGGGGFGGGAQGPFTPAPGAKDLKTVLFNWTWRMGMLRSGSEAELVKTLDYH